MSNASHDDQEADDHLLALELLRMAHAMPPGRTRDRLIELAMQLPANQSRKPS